MLENKIRLTELRQSIDNIDNLINLNIKFKYNHLLMVDNFDEISFDWTKHIDKKKFNTKFLIDIYKKYLNIKPNEPNEKIISNEYKLNLILQEILYIQKIENFLLLLSSRNMLSYTIGILKLKEKIKIVDNKRWSSVFENKKKFAISNNIPIDLFKDLWETIHLNSCKIQNYLVKYRKFI